MTKQQQLNWNRVMRPKACVVIRPKAQLVAKNVLLWAERMGLRWDSYHSSFDSIPYKNILTARATKGVLRMCLHDCVLIYLRNIRVEGAGGIYYGAWDQGSNYSNHILDYTDCLVQERRWLSND